MNRQPTRTLYVNLSASQTRKRLKGYGFGVKQVEAVDRNQAAITHTATGEHRRDLEALFVDVVSGEHRRDLDEPIENLRNLGPASAAWLREVGIRTRSDLEAVGPALAFRMVKRDQPKASLNLLWGLAAALRDVDWRELSEEERSTLYFQAHR